MSTLGEPAVEIRSAPDELLIVGQSRRIRDVLAQAKIVAPTDCTTLILGETGTGKELFARLIHDLSERKCHPFLTVSCAALPVDLLESELFGHERGAFTGAFSRRIGRFEAADKGTLFLDEVGDLPPQLQPKLLRILQEQRFERLGSTNSIGVDVRLVAATNRNLSQLVMSGAFRADLFYRLNVFPISLPPLREHPEDIPMLLRHFTSRYARQIKKRIDVISSESIDMLTRYSWPGNVRELQNIVERAVILSRGPVLEPQLAELRLAEAVPAEPVTLEEAERAHIVRTLRKTNGQVAGAATMLGIPRTTLFYKMRRLGISSPRDARLRVAGSAA